MTEEDKFKKIESEIDSFAQARLDSVKNSKNRQFVQAAENLVNWKTTGCLILGSGDFDNPIWKAFTFIRYASDEEINRFSERVPKPNYVNIQVRLNNINNQEYLIGGYTGMSVFVKNDR
jgi:hypothetical protein